MTAVTNKLSAKQKEAVRSTGIFSWCTRETLYGFWAIRIRIIRNQSGSAEG